MEQSSLFKYVFIYIYSSQTIQNYSDSDIGREKFVDSCKVYRDGFKDMTFDLYLSVTLLKPEHYAGASHNYM